MKPSNLYVMRKLSVPKQPDGVELDDFASYSYVQANGVGGELAKAELYLTPSDGYHGLNRTARQFGGYGPVPLDQAIRDDRKQHIKSAIEEYEVDEQLASYEATREG